ncbi:MAG: sugar phosphate nucleotidyltransferase [Verrucomicrobiota bacterium]
MNPTLLILAAGMGSRYGGLKQIDPMGPNGETLLDYSLNDAIAAGFGKVVFVIRQEFEETFRTVIGNKFQDRIEVAYAFQDLADLPEGFQVPEGRVKPWGTAHAIRAARNEIDTHFVAINADDYYGADAYHRIAEVIAGMSDDAGDIAMIGYPIENTLSPNGTVNRGICTLDQTLLKTVEEHTAIAANESGNISGDNLTGENVEIPNGALVSMNFWAFSPKFFEPLEKHFIEFLKANIEKEKSECYIPTVVDDLISSGLAHCHVYPTTGAWFGVTYPEDKALVQERLVRALSV